MTQPHEPSNMTANDIDPAQFDLTRTQAVVLVIDLVESVRLMQLNETGVIARWRGLVRQASKTIIPSHRGRLVKSLGDGLMVEFDSASQAVDAALALHRALEADNPGTAPDQAMYLRAGLHATHVYTDDIDIYGAGVNLAARLATLAGPGETIVSATVRDALTDGLDVEIEDLGECTLRNVTQPTRAYRVGAVGAHPIVASRKDYSVPFQPTIAVIPFRLRSKNQEHFDVGELIADGVIAHLSRARHLRVISRLSTTAFRGRDASVSEVEACLGATYVLNGSYSGSGTRMVISWELADARDHLVITASRLTVQVVDLLEPDCEIAHAIASNVHDAIFRLEVKRVQAQPVPTLESYALLLGGIQLLHRSSKRDFELSFDLLSHLSDRHRDSIEPRIWLAKWYALRAVQGLTSNRLDDAKAALACTSYALDRDPNNSFALAMEGFVHCHLSRNYEAASARLTESVEQNPSETFGHLFGGVIHGLKGDFSAGLSSFDLAASTSPLDPARYLLDSIGSYLYLGAGRHQQAIAIARRSLRQNRHHAHTWRILTIAQVESGDVESARESMQNLLKIQPGLTVKSYLADGKIDDQTRRRFAQAMQAAGLPTR